MAVGAGSAVSGELTDSGIQRMLGAGSPGSSRRMMRDWLPPEVADLQKALPQYEVRAFLARGGMGAVYQCVQRSLQRMVAIKVMPPEMEDDPLNFADRFKNEALAMARLTHPGIVAVYDAGETPEGWLYFVMEYVEGTDLARIISSEGRLEPRRALEITEAVCEALAFAHQNGIVHRDVKPSNIMLDRTGKVKVADFGLAKATTAESTVLTQTSMALGTPDYVAPECLISGTVVDGRADLYAVGVMLYQMLTGEIPRGRFALPTKLVSGLDSRVDKIVDRAMQTQREARYSSAPLLLRDVTRVLDSIRHSAQRRRRLIWALAAVMLLIVSALGFQRLKPGPPMSPEEIARQRPNGWYRTFEPGVWSPVTVGVEDSPTYSLDDEGWSRLPSWIAFTPQNARGTNWGVKATFRGEYRSACPELLLREDGLLNYNAYLDDGGAALTIQRCHNKAVKPHVTLAKVKLPKPILRGEPYTLEFYGIGRRIIARVNDLTVDLVVPEEPWRGRSAIYGIRNDAFRDVQHLRLDGLSELEALRLAGVADFIGPPRPAAGGDLAPLEPVAPLAKTEAPQPIAFPVGKWIRLPLDPLKMPFLKETDTGWFTAINGTSTLPTPVKGTNWGIRVTFRQRHRAQVPELILRSSSESNYNAYLENAGKTLTIQRFDAKANPRYKTLIQHRLPTPLVANAAYTLEFYAIGQHLIARRGNEWVEVETDIPSDVGLVSVYGIHFDHFRDVELINLESLSETEAMRLVKSNP